MAVCEISGKGKMYGHNVSFSQHKTRKIFKPNIQKKTLIIDGKNPLKWVGFWVITKPGSVIVPLETIDDHLSRSKITFWFKR